MDDRTYIRLHDGMPDHPKVVGLSDAAFRLYVEALCWCSKYLTDGAVPAAGMRRMGGWSPEAVGELASAGLIHPADDASHMRSHNASQNGSQSPPVTWMMHDYTEHQRTAAEVAAVRKAKHAAAVVGNHERWHKARDLRDPACELCAADDDASHMRSDMRSDMQSHSASADDRKHVAEASQETETESKRKKELKTIDQCGSDDDPDFTSFWSIYPRKVGKGQARKAWRAAVRGRHIEPAVIIATADHFRDVTRRERTETKYIPHPTSWLNGERYDDSQDDSDAASPAYSNSPYGN